MDRFDDKDIDNKCMVKGCDNDRDLASTQHLCRLCYDVITTGDTLLYYQRYMGKNWISDTAMKIFHAKEDNKELESVIKELKLEMKEAYILEDNTALSLDDLRRFYHENKDLREDWTRLRAHSEKQCGDLLDKIFKIRCLEDENQTLKKDINYKKEVIDSIEEITRNKQNRENLPLIHENQALKKRVEFLEKETSALVYNMDHAYNLGDGHFLTLDNLHDFYTDNRNVDMLLQQYRDDIHALENAIEKYEIEVKTLESKLSKKEDFATQTKEHFEKRAAAVDQNVKFEAYTSGFWKGFDMGYEKAKDQYYE